MYNSDMEKIHIGILLTLISLFIIAIVLGGISLNKGKEAADKECGNYRVVSHKEVKIWLPFRDGMLEVTCGTDVDGVSRTVIIPVK